MIFKGTEKRPVGQIEKEIKSYGGYINASTDHDTTSFYITVPSDFFKEACGLLCDAVMNPVFDEKEIEKERTVILSEIKMHNDEPFHRISRLLFENAYLFHPYRHPIIGYENLLSQLKKEDIASYHKKFYVPNNMVVAVSGNVDAENILEAIKDTFGKYERGFIPTVISQTEPEQISERVSEEESELNLGYLMMGYHSTGVLDRDLFALDALATALGAGNDSMLNRILVKEKEFLYSVTSFNYTPLYPGLFSVSGVGDPPNLKKAVLETKKIIQNLKQNGITEEELKKVKALVLSGYMESLQSIEVQANTMAEGQIAAGDPEFSRIYVDGIKNVESEDIIRVANKYLRDENCTIVYLNPKSEIRNPKQIQTLKTKAEKHVLSNGMRVVLKEEHELPLVSIVFSCLGGLRAEAKDNSGICNLTSEMLLKGTKKRKESEIKGFMERAGGSIDSFSGMNSFGISLKFMSDDLDSALDLLGDVIKNPDFPEDELNKTKKRIIADIKMEDDDLYKKGFSELKKGLFKAHPYGRRISGEIQAIEKISRLDIAEFYEKLLNPKEAVMSVVGDFDSKAVLGSISRRFSTVKAGDYIIEQPAEDIIEKSEEKTLHMPKEQALFVIGFDGVDFKNEDKYVLEVIFSIMSGADGRLYHSIRDSFGLSYAQGASSIPGLDPGFCFFYIAADKKDIYKAKEAVLNEIRKINKEGALPEELSSAKNSLIGKHLVTMQTNDAKALVMSLDELYSLGYDNYLAYKEKIEKCEKSDIMKVTNKYFDLEKSYSVIILPGEETQ